MLLTASFLSELPLTVAEHAEVTARPLAGTDSLTDEQVAVRQSVAAKVWALFLAEDTSCPAWARAIYAACPPWQFYVDRNDEGLPRRVYGVAERADGAAAHAVSFQPLLGGVVWLIGDPLVNTLRAVDQWPLMARLRLHGPGAGVFLDPLGFLPIQRNAIHST